MGFLNNLSEKLNKSIYSKDEAEVKNDKNLSTTSSEKDIESNYISYDPFSSYTNSTLGDQNTGFANRKELIGKWRKAIWNPEVDEAINEIMSEAIVFDEQEKVISLNLDDLDISKNIKEKILNSFEHILFMLDFNRNGEDIFKKWYVDGQLNIEAIYDNKKIKEGIQKLKILSPFNIWKIKNEKTNEIKFILTDDRPSNNYAQNIKTSERIFELEQITQIVSGLWSSDGKTPMSYLQKAIKSINQLNLLEDAVVIWHITRSPEKRVFYIDTGNLPKAKAEEYIKRLISKYRQKKVYNADSGSLESRSKSISILEDFWLPRNCISLDTKISLLDGREVELQELITDFKNGIENWTYSVSPKGEIVPGKISWAGITKRDTEVMKVTLDNNETITATPDHKFILHNGIKVQCKNLKEGDSLIGKKISSIENHKVLKIEKLTERQDTGTLTIDENHEYHDYHNFALSAGIFIMNSQGRGTEIDTLAAQSSGMESMEHIEYFVNKIYKGLNIPRSRRDKENTTVINTGIDVEKDELKFFKFVLKLRRRFNNLFIDLLKKDLLAKKVIKLKEWEIIQEQIKFRYADNNPYSDIKKMQILELRMGIAANAIDMVENEFLSKTWIRREILKQTEEDIDQIKKELTDEQKAGDEPDEIDEPDQPSAPEPEEKAPKAPKEPKPDESEPKNESTVNNIVKNLKEGDILSNGTDNLIYLNGKLELYEQN